MKLGVTQLRTTSNHEISISVARSQSAKRMGDDTSSALKHNISVINPAMLLAWDKLRVRPTKLNPASILISSGSKSKFTNLKRDQNFITKMIDLTHPLTIRLQKQPAIDAQMTKIEIYKSG